MSGVVRPQLSPEEVKAQRAAKAVRQHHQDIEAEKQNRVALALEKKNKEAAAKSAGNSSSSSTSNATLAPPTPTTSSPVISATSLPNKPPKSQRQASGNSSAMSSPAHTPSMSSTTAGAVPSAFQLDRRESTTTAKQNEKSKGKDTMKRHQPMMQFDDPKRVAIFDKKAVVVRTAVQKQVPLFSHLPQYERETSLSLKLKVGFSSEEIHPAILRLGLQFASGNISGSNARCVAMLTALKQFIADYRTPPAKVMRDDLLSKLKPLVRFLIDSRPQSISMGNAIRYLKMKISKIGPSIPESRAKDMLLADINLFITERIELADEVIATHGCSKINEGDVVLTFATSHVVELLLLRAHAEGKQFRLIIVDSRPKLEGKELLRRLVKVGIKCTYIMINALSYVMKEVNKVFLGAAACLSNGSVISRVGTAVVSMIAHLHNVPVLICCETYKFHERVQLDSIGFNELGDPDELILTEADGSSSGSSLTDWRDLPNIKLLNLVFDLTPAEMVTMVITEHGMIPPTSVPVILREYHREDTGEEGN